jgi:hypothetical protein
VPDHQGVIDMSEAGAKNPVGRPSGYKPEYCEQIVAKMTEGLSLMAACGELDLVKSTVHNWSKDHPELLDAIALGHSKRSAFLERAGIKAESGPAVTYITKALPNCNPDAFRERQSVEHTGKDGAPLIPESDPRALAKAVLALMTKADDDKPAG